MMAMFAGTRFAYSEGVCAAYSTSTLLNVGCLDYRLINESSNSRNVESLNIDILDQIWGHRLRGRYLRHFHVDGSCRSDSSSGSGLSG